MDAQMKRKYNKIIVICICIIILIIFNLLRRIIYERNLYKEKDTHGIINISDYNIDSSGNSDITDDIKNIMNYAAENNMKLIITPGIYSVKGLEIPSNLSMECLEGSVFKLIDNAGIWSRCVEIANVSNIYISGELTINGNEINQSYKNEHMHGLFIYNSNNIYIENVNSYSAVGDNVNISGGSDRFNDYSHDIKIDHINATKAGRKNLVLEHVTKLYIGSAWLNNIEGGNDGNGGNSLDVEPFDYHGRKMVVSIDYLNTVGCGNDFTAGTDKKANNYIVNISEFEAEIKDLPCLVDDNVQFNKSAIFSYGITLNIDYMKVNLAETITKLEDGTFTNPSNVFNLCHSADLYIKNLEINGGVKGEPIFISSNGYTHMPKVNIDNVIVNGIMINDVEQYLYKCN